MRKQTKKALKDYEESLTGEQRKNLVREAKTIIRKFDYGRRQLFWAFVLLGLGFFYMYRSIEQGEISSFSEGLFLGEGAILVLWGFRELYGGLMEK